MGRPIDREMMLAHRIAQAAARDVGNRPLENQQWGSSSLVAIGGPIRGLIDIQGDGQFPSGMTLTLSQIWPAGVAPAPYRGGIVGSLEWGSGGYQARAEIDFANGVSFSLSGDSLRLSARNEISNPAIPPLLVGAFVSYGARPSRYVPIRTFPDMALVNYVPPAVSPFFAVPAFARTVKIQRGLLVAPGFTGLPDMAVHIFDAGAPPTAITSLMVGANEECPEILLPPNASSVRVDTMTQTIPSGFLVSFGLAL